MNPEQATFLRDHLLPQIEQESDITRRVLTAIPEEKRDYRPDPRSRSAFELAWHLVNSEIWFFDCILHGHFGGEPERMPPQIKSIADIAAWHEKNVPGLIADLRRMTVEQLTRPVAFFGISNEAAAAYLGTAMLHTAHHRGQLAAYLRSMGGKVPCMYGGSADEPFQVQTA
jgi:uncharacterized damage-inducible protein DinB